MNQPSTFPSYGHSVFIRFSFQDFQAVTRSFFLGWVTHSHPESLGVLDATHYRPPNLWIISLCQTKAYSPGSLYILGDGRASLWWGVEGWFCLQLGSTLDYKYVSGSLWDWAPQKPHLQFSFPFCPIQIPTSLPLRPLSQYLCQNPVSGSAFKEVSLRQWLSLS